MMHCLESKEYMEVRNALHVLTRIVDVFPAIKNICTHLERKVAALKDEDRKDLQTLAAQYHSQLVKIKPQLQTQESFNQDLNSRQVVDRHGSLGAAYHLCHGV